MLTAVKEGALDGVFEYSLPPAAFANAFAPGRVSSHGSARSDDGRVEEVLRLRERAIITATHNGIVVTDATAEDHPIVYVNRALARITGYCFDEAVGRNPRFLQVGDDDLTALNDLRKGRKFGTTTWSVRASYAITARMERFSTTS